MRVQSYRDRYGSAFPAVGEALISFAMPLAAPLARWHLGLSEDQPPRRVHPKESRWLEGLAKGQLESTFSQMAQQHRFGAPRYQLESMLVSRVQGSAPLVALIKRMGDVQTKWLRATAPIFTSRLPQESPDKLILNVFATHWALATEIELHERAKLCAESYREGVKKGGKLNLATERMREAISLWANAVLDARWDQAMRMIGLIETQWIELDLGGDEIDYPRILSSEEERCMAGLHLAMKWVILGRWGSAFMALHFALFTEEEELENEEHPGDRSEVEASLDESVTDAKYEQENEQENDQADAISVAEDDQEEDGGDQGSGEDQTGDPEEEDDSTRSKNIRQLLTHAMAAFEAIEQLCSLCHAPVVALPLQGEDQVGQRAWTLLEPLGDDIWRAQDGNGMMGSLKEIWPLGNEEWSTKTQQEAIALNGITHPHIAPIQDWGVDPHSGRWFITYPFVYGLSLIERVEETPLSEAQARSFFLQLTDALKRGLKTDLAHRQLRPENIIFYSEEQLALTRWGVHRFGLPAWRSTGDQSPWRRCFYAPESWSSGLYDGKSDVYSLGILLAYALGSDALKLAEEWEEILTMSQDQVFPHWREWVDLEAIPIAYRELIAKATKENPEERYSSVSAFEQALKDLKPLYNYRGEFGERDGLSLMEVVSLILTKPKALHSIWQGHLRTWLPWREVDEIEQVVSAALKQQEAEAKAAEEQRLAEEEEKVEPKPTTPRSPRRSLVKKPSLNRQEKTQKSSSPRRKSPMLNPYLLKGSVAEDPGTLHTITFDGVPLQLCYIPQGDFLMGSSGHTPISLRVERPQHVVSIKRPFLMSQTPVTQGFYAALMGVNPSYFEDWEAPVEQISWREAAEFCNHLSKLDGLPLVYHFKEEEVEEEVEEEAEEDHGDDGLAHLIALRKSKRGEEKKQKKTAESTEESSDEEHEEDVGKEEGEDKGTEEAEGEEVDHGRSKEEEESEEESEEYEEEDKDNPRVFALSAEKEQEPEKDELRRQILMESEQELEEKSKRRYQLTRVKEAVRPRVWLKCDLNCGGYRLPTEAEWEYAARAGTNSLPYAGSTRWEEVAWKAPPAAEGTQPVSRLKSNGWKLYDMSGNVAEWCTDEQRVYTRNCVDPSQGATQEWSLLDQRSIRGGGWKNPQLHGRLTARGKSEYDQRRNHIGFRVVRPLLPVSPFENSSEGGSKISAGPEEDGA